MLKTGVCLIEVATNTGVTVVAEQQCLTYLPVKGTLGADDLVCVPPYSEPLLTLGEESVDCLAFRQEKKPHLGRTATGQHVSGSPLAH